MGKVMRLFIALKLPPATIVALEALQQQLQQRGRQPVKWVAPEAMHLTLVFLGDVEAERSAAIVAALRQASQHDTAAAQALLRLGPAGAFPNARRPQTLWVGVAGDTPRLARVQQAVTQALEPLGFAPEERPFRAHLTLGRVRRDATPQQRAALGAALEKLPVPVVEAWPMGAPILFESILTRDGALYKRIDDA
jgi:2'-5' RNA ligase